MQRISRNSFRPLLLFVCLSFAFVQLGCPPDDPEPDLIVSFDDDSPSVIEQSIEEGGDPVTLEVELTNTGTCALAFTASHSTVDGLGWLGVSPDNGNVAIGISTFIDVVIDVSGPPQLLAGTYTGTIIIDGECTTNSVPAAGSPIVIAVNLTVTPVVAGMEINDDRLEQDIVSLTDEWEPMAIQNTPAPRIAPTAVWTGSRMVVWGGFTDVTTNTGGLYEPITDTWTSTALAAAPTARRGHTAVWTGTNVWVMGGTPDVTGISTYLNDGGLFDPNANTWSALPDHGGLFTGRYGHTAIWTGSRIILWGGYVLGGATTNTGLKHFVGGPWTVTSTGSGVPEARANHTAVWTGTHMIVWGGQSGASVLNSGAMLELVTDNTWVTMALEGAPSARELHSAVWTGKEMIVWGGQNGDSTPLNDGGRYDPYTNQWRPMNTDGAPPLYEHVAVWTGDRMLVWGINDVFEPGLESGGIYDPETDSWELMTTDQAPENRLNPAYVWTGQEMLVWGGFYWNDDIEFVYPLDGGSYR